MYVAACAVGWIGPDLAEEGRPLFWFAEADEQDEP